MRLNDSFAQIHQIIISLERLKKKRETLNSLLLQLLLYPLLFFDTVGLGIKEHARKN